MLIEQSFYALPEFLVGTGFDRYDSEATLVMAYAMAVLQEFNGRNVNNPIAQISAEIAYPSVAERAADLRLKYDSIGTFSAELSDYGVRKENWLEAKFFRKNDQDEPTLVPTAGSYAILRDFIRLCSFLEGAVGRYFLHAYQGAPKDHLALERNVGDGGGRAPRGWLKDLHTAGARQLKVGDLNGEPTEFDRQVGANLRGLDLTMDVTTLEIFPPGAKYSLHLTRIDAFVITVAGQKVALDRKGAAVETPVGAAAAIRTDVAASLAK